MISLYDSIDNQYNEIILLYYFFDLILIYQEINKYIIFQYHDIII